MTLRFYEQTPNNEAVSVRHQPTRDRFQLSRIQLYNFLLYRCDEETVRAAAKGWPRNRSYSFPDLRFLFHQAQLYVHADYAFPS